MHRSKILPRIIPHLSQILLTPARAGSSFVSIMAKPLVGFDQSASPAPDDATEEADETMDFETIDFEMM
jgi:hypothetical protein